MSQSTSPAAPAWLSQDPREQILVSQSGSLPRSDALIEANAIRELDGDGFTLKRTPEYEQVLTSAVVDLVQRQVELGVSVPGDGEYGHATSAAVAWRSYIFQRVGGLAVVGDGTSDWPHVESTPGRIKLTNMANRRDRVRFRAAYEDPEYGGIRPHSRQTKAFATADELFWRGQDAIDADIANLRAGLDAVGLQTGFLAAVSPGSAARLANVHYATDEEHLWAWAEVLRNEYKSITDAGLIVQIDDPSIAENWDQITPEPSVEDYRAFTRIRVEALNWAIRDLPEELVRFHACWGSWHGPHTTDIEFRHIVDLVLQINARYYTFEAANPRHEHEYTVWDEVALPEGKVIVPGVVSHATNVVEHPELVAQRISRFTERVGRENVQAGTDCGLGGRLHPQIAFAKLEALAQGAALATERTF